MKRCPYTQKELTTPDDIVYMSCGHEYHHSLKRFIEAARFFKCGVFKCLGARIISYDQSMNLHRRINAEIELVPDVPKFIETVVIQDDSDEYKQIDEKKESVQEIVKEKYKGIVIIPESEDDEDGNRIVLKRWKLGSLREKRCRRCEYPMKDLYHPYKWVPDKKNGGEKLRKRCDFAAIAEELQIEKHGFGTLIRGLAMGERIVQ